MTFDVNGTLANAERHGHRVAFNRAFARAGLDWFWDEALYGVLLKVAGGKERMAWSAVRFHPAWLASATSGPAIAAIHADKTALYAQLVRSGAVPLRPGVVALARRARQAGVALAIATTTSRANVDILLQTCFPVDLEAAFGVIAAAEDAPAKKPAPDVYLDALACMGLAASEALAIEDLSIGLAAASAAGLRCLVTWNDYTRDEPFTGAIGVAASLEDATFTFENGKARLEAIKA